MERGILTCKLFVYRRTDREIELRSRRSRPVSHILFTTVVRTPEKQGEKVERSCHLTSFPTPTQHPNPTPAWAGGGRRERGALPVLARSLTPSTPRHGLLLCEHASRTARLAAPRFYVCHVSRRPWRASRRAPSTMPPRAKAAWGTAHGGTARGGTARVASASQARGTTTRLIQ